MERIRELSVDGLFCFCPHEGGQKQKWYIMDVLALCTYTLSE
jgi:hypothetical protein